MKTFTAYQCEHCNDIFKEKELCVKHEESCSYDKKNKSCNTCKHHAIEWGNAVCHQEGVYEYYDETLPNCPKWEEEK